VISTINLVSVPLLLRPFCAINEEHQNQLDSHIRNSLVSLRDQELTGRSIKGSGDALCVVFCTKLKEKDEVQKCSCFLPPPTTSADFTSGKGNRYSREITA
jgi:hypothetical protein